MVISSDIWDWTAALTELRPNENFFLPAYWRLPARALASLGWVPTPEFALWTLITVTLILSAVYFTTRRSIYMGFACAIWGFLLADTPYVLLVPAFAWFAWTQLVRLARFIMRRHYDTRFPAPIRRFLFVFVLTAILSGAFNLYRYDEGYIPGYARNALAVLRWDGGWHPWTCWDMDRLLNDYVAEMAREAEGRQWIFTDGLCDAGIELASGGKVKAVSLADSTTSDITWRQRGFTRIEDISALERGTVELLRAWTLDRPDNLKDAVFQCGHSFLEQMTSNRLEYCGFVMREPRSGGWSVEEADLAVKGIAERIVAFYERGRNDPDDGGAVRRLRFCSMQWRVARAIRRQALALDRQQRTREALAMTELSERLDRLNPVAKRSDVSMEAFDKRVFSSLTPRERLRFSLRQANFSLAQGYARQILEDEPENTEANFAVAMSHHANREYAQAQHHFEIALKGRPDDPTLLNNLADTLMELGKLDEAMTYAQAALKAKPNNGAIRNTIRQIERRRKGGR